MRSFVIFCLCLGALAGGAGLAYLASNHVSEIEQAVKTSNVENGGTAWLPSSGAMPAAPETAAWKRPAVIPAHPHWVWNMPSGKTYEDVVITDVSPTEVTITHSLGVAHLSYKELPPDVLKELDQGAAASSPAAVSQTP